MKILIADDDKALVHMLMSKLSTRGYEVIVAYDAVQAWVSIMRFVPSAVVLDVSMPGGTGIEVLRKLKRFPKTNAISTVVISGSVGGEFAQTAKALGADDVLVKPFTAEELAARLERITGWRSSESPVQPDTPAFGVLVADDDAATRRALEALLLKWGYGVVAVSGGQQAWEVLQRADAPQLAILDWVMPDLEGIELCRILRAQTSEQYTYVLLLTGRSEKVDLIEGMSAGADDYIVKPFDPGELKVRVAAGRRVLGLQQDLLAARSRMKPALYTATGNTAAAKAGA